MGELKEKCAVVGVSTANSEVDAAEYAFLSLEAMQHRGDAASGIASYSHEGRFEMQRGPGMVKDVFTPQHLARLAGSSAIGHNRYPTSGGVQNHDQPVDDKALRFALDQNGQLSTTSKLELFLSKSHIDTRHLNDTEQMAYGIATLMRQGNDLPAAIERIYPLLEGAFSCTAIQDDMVVAFRDPLGIRPLSYGTVEDGHMTASETCAFYASGAHHVGDVAPGEIVIVQKDNVERRQIAEPNLKFDIFEIVYFAREDSEFFGESVGQMRYRLGQELAEQYPFEGDNYLVTGVPDSAIEIAHGFANARKLEYRQVIKKNRFRGGRSFQQPNQEARRRYLDRKFNYIGGAAVGRDLLVIDDSIVRLNTARKVNERLLRAGARSVTFLSGSPPIGFPDFSGIDIPNQEDLVAYRLTPDQIRQEIGCQGLGYLSLSRMVRATGQPASVFNLSSFTGEYPYNIGEHRLEIRRPVSEDYLEEASAC